MTIFNSRGLLPEFSWFGSVSRVLTWEKKGVLWVCLPSPVASDRQSVNTTLCCLISVCVWGSGDGSRFSRNSALQVFVFSLSWKPISHTDTQTPTHHSYYGCLISVAQESLLSMRPNKHLGWYVAGSLLRFDEWYKMCDMFLTSQLTFYMLCECSFLTVSWHHNVLQLRELHCNYSYDSHVLLSCFVPASRWSAELWRRFVVACFSQACLAEKPCLL